MQQAERIAIGRLAYQSTGQLTPAQHGSLSSVLTVPNLAKSNCSAYLPTREGRVSCFTACCTCIDGVSISGVSRASPEGSSSSSSFQSRLYTSAVRASTCRTGHSAPVCRLRTLGLTSISGLLIRRCPVMSPGPSGVVCLSTTALFRVLGVFFFACATQLPFLFFSFSAGLFSQGPLPRGPRQSIHSP